MYSCSTISPKTPVIIGPHIIDTTGAVKEVHPVQTLSVVGLYKIGDKQTIELPSLVDFDVRIDTTNATIITTLSRDEKNDRRLITYEVVHKASPLNIVFEDTCDFVFIPSTEILINLIDNYNKNSKNNKKNRLIITPEIDSYSKDIIGYFITYFDESGYFNCKSYNDRLKTIINGYVITPDNSRPTSRPNKRNNCPEYKMFNKKCP